MEQGSADIAARLTKGFATALGADAAEVAHYVTTGEGKLPGSGASLFAWDVHSVHDFVFDTTNAAAIRGASKILVGIDNAMQSGKALGIHLDQVLFAGAGNGLAVVKAEDVPAFVQRFHQLLAEETLVASGSAVAIPLDSTPFGQQVERVSRELDRVRLRTMPDVEPAVPFFAERCAVCGRRAATIKKERRSGPRLECVSCERKLKAGSIRGSDEAEDFDQIAKDGSYAVLYLDGNGFGSAVSGLASPLDYEQFSRAATQTFKSAFEDQLEAFGIERRRTTADGAPGENAEPRYQCPIRGGDDLIAILPGALAVPFARELMRAIEQKADDDPILAPLAIGASAGVAIGRKTFPVRHLLHEAQALLRSAKRRIYAEAGVDGRAPFRSTLDFEVVLDGQPTVESEPRDRINPQLDRRFLRNGRPYALPELDVFSRRFRLLKAQQSIGRTQRYDLSRHAARGPAQLRNHVLYQIGRREEWRALADLLVAEASPTLPPASDAATLADRYVAQFLPSYGGQPAFDIADMIELDRFWEEPKP